MRARELGITVGTLKPGNWNTITDVPGVAVGHTTMVKGDDVRTGVTAILPHSGNIFQEKVPAAIDVANGFGKMVGFTQVAEVGTIETPIVLTSTLCVGIAATALIRQTLSLPGNEDVISVNPVVAETNDYHLNDVRGIHLTESDVLQAISAATSGPVPEGNVGGGTGMKSFSFKSGIGTASREIPLRGDATYVIGVLVQSNFGGVLELDGLPVERLLAQRHTKTDTAPQEAGSCLIVIATNAPFSVKTLQRIARRSFLGLGKTGSFMTHGSGDYAICFSTAYRLPHGQKSPLSFPPFISDEQLTPFFQAVIEATQEAIYNSLTACETMTGFRKRTVRAIPRDALAELMRRSRG